MAERTELQVLLENILGSDAVYFQPPMTIKLVYPCIIYERSRIQTRFGDNIPYNHEIEYTIMLIYRDPDSSIPIKIASLPKTSFNRHYVMDNLNHDIFTIFF
jgi:hypothetical protein